MNKRNILIIVLVVLLALTAIGAGAFVYWANDAAQPMPEALAAIKSDEFVQFTNRNGWLVFQPVNQADVFGKPLKTGLIIYPGGKVDYRAYAPTARAIAAQGYLVVVPPLPLNLAFFDVNVAARIIQAFPQIQNWTVAGHSLGGVAASSFATAHRDQIKAIAFWASYPAGDMKNFAGRVVSISGTNDGLATPAKIDESKMNLPASTEYLAIQGGNHAQFGYYGAQGGDDVATISRAEQQEQIIAATIKLLQSLGTE